MLTTSWKTKGLIEVAWKRLAKPTRDELARCTGIPASNLSGMNTGRLVTTMETARKICAVVPGLTAADLGAPSSVVAEVDLTVLDRLGRLEEEAERERAALTESLASIDVRLERIEERLDALDGRDSQAHP